MPDQRRNVWTKFFKFVIYYFPSQFKRCWLDFWAVSTCTHFLSCKHCVQHWAGRLKRQHTWFSTSFSCIAGLRVGPAGKGYDSSPESSARQLVKASCLPAKSTDSLTQIIWYGWLHKFLTKLRWWKSLNTVFNTSSTHFKFWSIKCYFHAEIQGEYIMYWPC